MPWRRTSSRWQFFSRQRKENALNFAQHDNAFVELDHPQRAQELWGQHLSADQRRRQARKVTRLLKRLHLRGLLAKIPHTRRWRVTALGPQLLGALVQLYYHGLATAI